MAVYFFEFGFVSRSGGTASKPYSKNSIAKAAYDSRENLTDERTGENFSFRWKGLPEWTGIFLPEGAPKWMRNRSELWNGLEKREEQNRKADQATLSRTFKIGIPKEFDTEEKRERFVLDYGKTLSRQGYVADIAIHPPEGKDPNWHIHAHLPFREVGPDGFGKRIRLNGPEWDRDSRKEMTHQKENFVNLAARHLERYGHKLEADRFRHAHKKLPEQMKEAVKRGDLEFAKELDREPTIHMGPAATAMERDGIATRKGDINREIAARNFERQEYHKSEQLLASLPAGITVPEGLDRRNAPVWLALERSKTAAEFRDNLRAEGWELGRVDKADAEKNKSRRLLSEQFDGPYKPEFIEGDYAVVNRRGMAFHLNEKTTGRSFREMKKFMAELDKEAVNTLSAAENFALHRLSEIQRGKGGRKQGVNVRRGVRKGVHIAKDAVGTTMGVAGIGLSLIGAIDRKLTPEQKVRQTIDKVKKQFAAKRNEAEKKIERPKDLGRERD